MEPCWPQGLLLSVGDTQWLVGQMVHPESGGKDGWVGLAENPA